MPGKRFRKKATYITHLLRERHQVVVDIYKPQRGASVDDVLEKFKRINDGFGKPKIPDIAAQNRVIRRESNASKIRKKSVKINEINTENNDTDKVEDEVLYVQEYEDDFHYEEFAEEETQEETTPEPPPAEEEVHLEEYTEQIPQIETQPQDTIEETIVESAQAEPEEEKELEKPEVDDVILDDDYSVDSELLQEVSIEEHQDNGKTYHTVVELHQDNLFRSFIEDEWSDLLDYEYQDKSPENQTSDDKGGAKLNGEGRLAPRVRSATKTKDAKPTLDFRTAPQKSLVERNGEDYILSNEGVAKMVEVGNNFTELTKQLEEQKDKLETCLDKFNEIGQKVDGVRKSLGTCQMIWKIRDFKAKCEDKSVLYSPAFETHPYGYRLAVSLVPNGDGSGTGKFMSIFFCILQGKFDHLLKWPFCHPLTFTLLDQSESDTVNDISARFVPNVVDKNLVFLGKPETFRNPSLGMPKFAPLSEVWRDDGNKYVKDDTLFIRIQVNVTPPEEAIAIVTEGELEPELAPE